MSSPISRRKFFSNLAMWGALAASYGTGAFYALRYLLPEKKTKKLRKVYVAPAESFTAGKTLKFKLPDGNEALIFRSGEKFLAFSNTCPHLGCKVKWQPQESNFFCPCHNGVFDPNGTAIAGPPAQEKKNLRQYGLERDGNSLYILVEEA